MKKTILLMLSALTLISCRQQNVKTENVRLRHDIERVLDSIMEMNKPSKVYELYIDKKDQYNSDILFYFGSTSLTEEDPQFQSGSFLQTELNDKIIKIYSGVEKYISSNNVKNLSEISAEINPDRNCWVIKDRNGKLKIYEVFHAYPFCPFPLNSFSPPDIQ
ncbi:hypothetical protein [Bacteroides sedimenti]